MTIYIQDLYIVHTTAEYRILKFTIYFSLFVSLLWFKIHIVVLRYVNIPYSLKITKDGHGHSIINNKKEQLKIIRNLS